MGESFQAYMGRSIGSVAEMSFEDWKGFFIASAGHEGNRANEFEEMFKDDSLAAEVLDPLIADCKAYESYTHCDATRLRFPILTLRGEHDHITDMNAMKSWSLVSSSRLTSQLITGVGHMIVRDAPRRIAMAIEHHLRPDFSHQLSQEHSEVRQQYQSARMGLPFASPVLGTVRCSFKKQDEFDLDLAMTLLEGSEQVTPQTRKMKEFRAGNANWRLQNSSGNPMRNP